MKTLFIMVGIPGSGKDWIIDHKILPHARVSCVSRDEIRFSLLGESDDYFSQEKKVYNLFIENIVGRLTSGASDVVVADATHLSWISRHKLIVNVITNLPQDFQLNIVPIVVKCKLETALKRNSERSDRACVPEYVLKDMYGRMQDPKNDPFEYDGIMYVEN